MTEWESERLVSRLERKLGLTEVDEDTLLLMMDELLDAENELKLYLDYKELPKTMRGKVVDLAAVFYWRDRSEEAGKSNVSYSEGQISQSVSYLNPKEYRAAVAEILEDVARYRRVSC